MDLAVVKAFVKEAAIVVASGTVAGGVLYQQGAPWKVALTAGIVTAALQVLKDLLPAGAGVAVQNAKATTGKVNNE